LKAAGVRVFTGRTATAVRTDRNNAVSAVAFQEAGGVMAEADCDVCLYTGAPAALPRLLPENALRPVLVRRLLSLPETPAPFMLFGHTGSGQLAGRQLFIGPEGNLDDWLDPADPVLYVSGGPGHDGRWPVSAVIPLSPATIAAWRAGRTDAARPAGYYAFKERAAEKLRRRLLAVCPELNGDLETVESATGLTLERYSFNFGTGIYGTIHSIHNAPVLPVTRVGGLALAGQNIVMPGLLGVLVSAALAVGCLAGHRPVLEVLQ
jgi:all-trans-retinol 13,14-reductase